MLWLSKLSFVSKVCEIMTVRNEFGGGNYAEYIFIH